MKLKDYDESIGVIDKTCTEVLETLDGLDPRSDEYATAAQNLKTLQEAKQIEVRNKSEHLSGKVPAWATGILGTAVAVLFGAVVMKEERNGGVVSSQAVNLFDKVVRKF